MSLQDMKSALYADRFVPKQKSATYPGKGAVIAGDVAEFSSEEDLSARALLELLPAAIYTTDAAGRMTFYNQAAADLWGRRPKLGDAQWYGSWRLYASDGNPMAYGDSPIAVALRENRTVRGAEAVGERPDGTRVPFIPYPTPLHDADGNLTGAVNMLVDITERKAVEEALYEREARLELRAREIDHRGNNLLANVMALVRMTQADTVADFVESLTGRVGALSRVHSLLSGTRWQSADLRRMIEDELAAYRTGDDDRVDISGASVSLSPEVGQVLAMVIHELTTNSAKYGALSCDGGSLKIDWNQLSGGDLNLHWTEAGLPDVASPPHKGFGTSLIERCVTMQLGGKVEIDWPTGGLACEIVLPAEKLMHQERH